jgi:hypothetical protein
MKTIPATEDPLVLRTDYSDESAWQSLCATILEPVDGFATRVDFVSDVEFAGLEAEQLLSAPSNAPDRSFAFIVDQVALTHPKHPILVVDLLREPGRTFRVISTQVGAVADNLSLANMDFSEFAEAVDPDGIFRGFPPMPQRPPPPKQSFWKSLFR